MNPTQMASYQAAQNIPEGAEWDRFAGLDEPHDALETFLATVPMIKQRTAPTNGTPPLAMPNIVLPSASEASTQSGFGRIMDEIGRAGGDIASRVATCSPDVTVSTNLGGWVNQVGVFRCTVHADVFRERMSPFRIGGRTPTESACLLGSVARRPH